jgi:hypothetical protein
MGRAKAVVPSGWIMYPSNRMLALIEGPVAFVP